MVVANIMMLLTCLTYLFTALGLALLGLVLAALLTDCDDIPDDEDD